MEMEKGSKAFELMKTILIGNGLMEPRMTDGWKKNIYYIYRYLLHISVHGCTLYFMLSCRTAFEGGALYFAFYLPVALTFALTSLKMIMCQRKKVKSILTEMFNDEAYMNNNKHEGIRSIHISYSDANILQLVRFYVGIMIYIQVMFWIVCCFLYFQGRNCDVTDETCEKIQALPVNIPFDTQVHHGAATLMQMSVIVPESPMMVGMDIVFLSLTVNPLIKMNALRHVLSNFDEHAERQRVTAKCTLDQASFILARQCVIEHQLIISDFMDLRKSSSLMFAIDCYTRCFVNAPSLLILSESDDFLFRAFIGGCELYVFLQLFLLYYQAQRIIDESIGIARALCESNWYTKDKKTQQCFLLIIVRSQKYLALKAGFMIEMNLDVFLKIVKTIYTFFTVYSAMF